MKKLGVIVVKVVSVVGIILATIVGVIIGGVIDFSYELICIIRYWSMRGLYEIMVRLDGDECLIDMWNDTLDGMSKDDAKKILEMLKLRIED